MTQTESRVLFRFLKHHGYRVRVLDDLLGKTKTPTAHWKYASFCGQGVQGMVDNDDMSGAGGVIHATAEGTMDKWRHVPLVMRLPLRGPRKNELLMHLRWLGRPENRHVSVPRYGSEGYPGIPHEI